jgi:hypothetical protein
MDIPGSILPFVCTDACHGLALIEQTFCQPAAIAVIYSQHGAGKSIAAKWLVQMGTTDSLTEQNVNLVYCDLYRGARTDYGLDRTLFMSIIEEQSSHHQGRVTVHDVDRAVRERGIRTIILDDTYVFDISGLMEVQRLRDSCGVAVMLLVDMQTAQRWSRIGDFWPSVNLVWEFKSLCRDDIYDVVLPNIRVDAHIYFDASARDAVDVVDTLLDGAGGIDSGTVSFRRIVAILEIANKIIELDRLPGFSNYANAAISPSINPAPLSVSLIQEAVDLGGLHRFNKYGSSLYQFKQNTPKPKARSNRQRKVASKIQRRTALVSTDPHDTLEKSVRDVQCSVCIEEHHNVCCDDHLSDP